jgi:hypothetical protein
MSLFIVNATAFSARSMVFPKAARASQHACASLLRQR